MMSHGSWWTSKRLPRPSSPASTSSYNTTKPFKPVSTTPRKSTTTSTSAKFSKHGDSNLEATVTVTVAPIQPPSPSESPTSDLDDTMSKPGNTRRHPSVASSAATMTTTRPISSTTPVQIPRRSRHNTTSRTKSHAAHQRKHYKEHHAAETISPSVAALLAITDIPRPRQSQRRSRKNDKALTVDDIIENQQASEKALSWGLTGGLLDVLLSPPDEGSPDGYVSGSESLVGSALTSARSADSLSSMGNSFSTDTVSLVETPSQRRVSSPIRRALEPIHSPPGAPDEHPLAANPLVLDGLESPLEEIVQDENTLSSLIEPFKPLRAAFKSNLTASLRALRLAAKSFSTLNFPALPPDDILTRSILTMDSKVPYTDERRPPVMEEMPSAEMRRYLNPSTRGLMETTPQTPSQPRPTSSGSIQMQTYKIYRSRSVPASDRRKYPSVAPQHKPLTPAAESIHRHDERALPGMRQREMRENPDFIRIAVMEMAMRKCGKLDNKRPGRARWALPPRRTSVNAYEVDDNGVPRRWIPLSCSY